MHYQHKQTFEYTFRNVTIVFEEVVCRPLCPEHPINIIVYHPTTRNIKKQNDINFGFIEDIMSVPYQVKIFIRGHRLFPKNNLQSTPSPCKQ